MYEFRQRFRKIFDSVADRQKAYRELIGLFLDLLDHSPERDAFIGTFEDGQAEILSDFEARQTSGAVEGLNNKTRVIFKRSYGHKGAESLWTRLILDVNRGKEVVLYTIDQIRGLVAGFRAGFACT